TSSTMPVWTNIRNPGNAADNLYGPTGRLGNIYAPVSLLITVRTWPVAVCVAVTSTPGKRAPDGSVTEPLICAVPCAQSDAENARINTTPNTYLSVRFISSPPLQIGKRLRVMVYCVPTRNLRKPY